MTGPSNRPESHVCAEIHPGIQHFLWITEQKKAEIAEAAASAPIDEALAMGADQVVLDFLSSPDFDEQYGQFTIEMDPADADRPQTVYSDYRLQVDAATADISFEEVFTALVNSGKIHKTERHISAWRGDSNKFMCPSPDHDNPGASSYSAWGSKDKGLWTCSKGCGAGSGGGDKFTLAAFLYNLPVGRESFHEIAERLAADFRGVKKPQPNDLLKPPVSVKPAELEDDADSKRAKAKEKIKADALADLTKRAKEAGQPEKPMALREDEPYRLGRNVSVRGIPLDSDVADWMSNGEEDGTIPTYDWRDVLAFNPSSDTFLHKYCDEASRDTTPEEFNLFNGLAALGLLVGNRVSSPDFVPLSPNFGLVLVAPSGGGKTRSVSHVRNVLHTISPYSRGLGIKFVSSPVSGQVLIRNFIHEEPDPISGAPVRFPVTGLVTYDEFSELATATGAMGSIIKEKLHAFIDHARLVEYQSMTSGNMVAEDAFATVITATQPDRFKDLLTKSDAASGFINRFLFVMGTPKPQRARGAVELDWSGAIDELKKVRSKYNSRKSLGWTPEADIYFEGLFYTRIDKLKQADKKDILTRLDLNTKRMILAFAINDRADQIEVHHVKMAEALLSYLVKCYGGVITRIVTSIKNDMVDWCHRRIAAIEASNYQKKYDDWVAAGSAGEFNPGQYGVTMAALKREYRKRDWQDDDVYKALMFLKNNDLITAMAGVGARGPKTTYYHSNEAPPQ